MVDIIELKQIQFQTEFLLKLFVYVYIYFVENLFYLTKREADFELVWVESNFYLKTFFIKH